MPKCIFDRATGRYVGGTRYDDVPHDPATHVQVEIPEFPDRRTIRWDGATGIRAATVQEILDYDTEQVRVREQREFDDAKMLRAVALVIADLHGLTPLQMRNLIVTKYRSL